MSDLLAKYREVLDAIVDTASAGSQWEIAASARAARLMLSTMTDSVPSEPMYLLQNVTAGYLGNSPVFWRDGGGGYTQWIDEAKHWTKAETEQQIRSTSGTHKWAMWSVDEIIAAARRTVDIQDLRNRRSSYGSSLERID